MNTRTFLAATAFLTILMAPAASASAVTFNFTGTLDLASPNGNIPGDFNTSSFQSTVTGSWTVDPVGNSYDPFYLINSMSGTAGSYTFSAGYSFGNNFEIVEHDVVDAIGVDASDITGADVGSYSLYQAILTLAAPAGTFLSSTAFPATLPPASAFTVVNQLDLNFSGGRNGADVIYDITSLSSSGGGPAAPEPATWALGLAGVGLLAWRRRRAV